jgi:Zn-dependent protease
MSLDLNLVQTIAIWALPVLFAVTLHEVAHGYAARLLGDPTAQMLGRLTLNPIKHVDPVGTIAVPLTLLVLSKLAGGSGFLFGWAKPVPVSARNLRHPRRDMALVAAAGPLANATMALGWGLLLKLAAAQGSGEGIWLGVQYMAVAGITINLVLMVLNLLPLPPLDGGRVLAGLLPAAMATRLDRLEPYGMVILIVLMVTGLLGRLLYVPLMLAEGLLYGALGLDVTHFF